MTANGRARGTSGGQDRDRGSVEETGEPAAAGP